MAPAGPHDAGTRASRPFQSELSSGQCIHLGRLARRFRPLCWRQVITQLMQPYAVEIAGKREVNAVLVHRCPAGRLCGCSGE